MNAGTGILVAILSCSFGGMAAAVTRFAIGTTDPITLAAFRFGLGFLILLPITLVSRSRWPQGRDWLGVALLGLLFFALFFVLYNLALSHTTAAWGALALSTLPLVTMIVGALLGIEPLTVRKTTGVLIAIGGVALALLSGLAAAPAGAWQGDLVMAGGTLCMALYNVWSRPLIVRSSALGFLTAGMGVGVACLVVLAWSRGGFLAVASFATAQWMAIAYLGVFGAALAFYLWVFALERATPTQVANAMTVNPVAASILAAILLGEPIGLNLVAGVIAVAASIWVASTRGRQAARSDTAAL